ncbi:MAG: TadE/TadG family type IV pilus assembly protein [Pirellulaceae bacterium]
MTNNKSRRKSRHGAVAVEFAIAISILLMVVFASVEFVRLNMLKHSVEHASYLAARRGIITGARSSDAVQVAEDHLAILGISNANVQVTPNTITDATQIVEVNISLPMTGNSWITPAFFNGTLTGRSRMLAERAAASMSDALPTI